MKIDTFEESGKSSGGQKVEIFATQITDLSTPNHVREAPGSWISIK